MQHTTIVVLVVSVCVVTIAALKISLREDFKTEKAHLLIRHHDNLGSRREKRDSSSFPEYTNVTIQRPGRADVTLGLRKTPNIDVNAPVYVTKGGRIMREELGDIQDVAVYKDPINGASILLEKVQSGIASSDGDYSVFGSFHTQEGIFVIQPHETEGHVVSQVPKQTVRFEMESVTGAKTYKRDVTESKTDRHQARVKRQQSATKNMVEIFIVVDYELYNFWYAMTSGSNRGTQTLQLIRQCMSYMLNEVDMRYESIGRSDYAIGILNAGMYVAQTPSDAPWSENNKFFGSPMYKLSTSTALDAFRSWVNEQTLFPSSDHVMGFTGYDLVSSGGGDSGGIAFTGALCTTSSRSLVEDHLTFISMTTATHELGHSLGVLHDGDDNACSSNDNYIMAITNLITDDPVTAPNLWLFSTCSKDAIGSFINRLSVNCMLTQSSSSAAATVDSPMAELYPPDRTCEYAQGTGSYVCRSIQNYTNLCTSMYCNDPGTTQCYTILPAEGTPCGKGKWCDNGRCVESPNAPTTVEDNCPIGDHPGLVAGYGMTCAQIVADNSGDCSISYIGKVCCESCRPFYTGVKGCEYGDKNVDFCSSMSRFGCYSNEQLCCARCPPLKNPQIPGCEFGDKLTGCRVSDCPFYNDVNRAGCCETCFDGTTFSTTTSTTPPTSSTTTKTTSTTTTQTTSASTRQASVSSRSTISSTQASTRPSTGSTSSVSSMSPTVSTNESVTEAPTEEGVSDIVIIGAGVAGGALILILVIVVVCIVRKRCSKTTEKSASSETYDNIGFVGNVPNRPPPRRNDSAVRSQPPGITTKPIKPSMPVFPLSNDKSDFDGYVKPASAEVKTVSDGVLYTAPDGSGAKPTNPHLRTVHNNTDPQKRSSKTIHYKRPSGIDEGKSGSLNNYTGKPGGETVTITTDVYDSIGQVDAAADGPATNGRHAHVPAMYHKPYNVHVTSPSLPERPASNSHNKPLLPANRPGKPLLPPIRASKQRSGQDNTGTRQENNGLKVEPAKAALNKSPMLPPKPVPRPNRNRIEMDNMQQGVGVAVGVYDIADGIEAKRLPLKPPNKPVPRRQPRDGQKQKSGDHGADNVGFDSDGLEIQI